jgi:uncharacterized protein (DUF1015 family)
MSGPVEDRLELLRATRTHLSPIYGTVGGPVEHLDRALTYAMAHEPVANLTDAEGVRHRMWRLAPDPAIATSLENEELLIADGHHRYTTGLAYRDERHAADGPGPWEAILTFVVDAGTQEVPVLPYHRVQLRGEVAGGATLVSGLRALEAALSDEAATIGVVARVDGIMTFGLLRLQGPPPAVRALHVEILDRLAPGEALAFTHTVGDAVRAVSSGDAVGAYILPPTTTEHVRDAIRLGERLPRKSTFFWPKPRTGMALMPVR